MAFVVVGTSCVTSRVNPIEQTKPDDDVDGTDDVDGQKTNISGV